MSTNPIKKAVLFVRASTDRQELDSQLKETKEYAESLGYNSFVIVGAKGASAYKVSTKYIELLDELKETIKKDPGIEAVICWALNRLSRNDKVALEIRDFLIENKIQLYVKEPYLKLFKDDGEVDPSAQFTFTVFSTMNKLQVDELRAKSRRAKTRDKSLRKYLGGKKPAYGYKVINKQVVPDVDEAKIVSEIFELYATGEYSINQLAVEISERHGRSFPKYRIAQILNHKLYYDGTTYPPIIDEILYKKVQSLKKQGWQKPTNYKYHYFGPKLIKCPICGRHFVADDDSYRCINRCSRQMISLGNLDGMLWLISSHLEGNRLVNESPDEEILQKKAVLEAKIKSVDKYTEQGSKRAERAKKMALKGYIEIEEFESIMEEVKKEQEEYLVKIENWKMEIARMDQLLKEDKSAIRRILDVSDQISGYDEQQMCGIVRKWVTGIDYSNEKVVTVHTPIRDYRLQYSRYNTRSRWSTVNGNPVAIAPIIRQNGLREFGKLHTKPEDIITTMAWLNGSEIV